MLKIFSISYYWT